MMVLSKHYHILHHYDNATSDFEGQPYTNKRKAQKVLYKSVQYAVSVGWKKDKGNVRIGYYLTSPKPEKRPNELLYVDLCFRKGCNGNSN